MLLLGDCLERLRDVADNCVDSIVTDPPYGLSFMGKKWDYDVPSVDIWREALRVLKPGGHLLAFGGTRTYHRLVVAIEDAGFEIRDQVQWIYGQGFPKSLDISKAIDKAAGAEREVIGVKQGRYDGSTRTIPQGGFGSRDTAFGNDSKGFEADNQPLTKAATDAAKQWSGWGTTLKPANEPICLARKPLEKGLTVAANVQKWGTGGLNIDGSRIESGPRPQMIRTETVVKANAMSGTSTGATNSGELTTQGRFPANVIFDEAAGEILDTSAGAPVSRFFYCAKASTSERNAGMALSEAKNIHPTVKPIKLMEYLIKLITPPGGIVLDPFMGSGTTGVAARNFGFNFIGIELNEEYFAIAKARINEPKTTP